jgi:hypothetical protein
VCKILRGFFDFLMNDWDSMLMGKYIFIDNGYFFALQPQIVPWPK